MMLLFGQGAHTRLHAESYGHFGGIDVPLGDRRLPPFRAWCFSNSICPEVSPPISFPRVDPASVSPFVFGPFLPFCHSHRFFLCHPGRDLGAVRCPLFPFNLLCGPTPFDKDGDLPPREWHATRPTCRPSMSLVLPAAPLDPFSTPRLLCVCFARFSMAPQVLPSF